MSRTGLEQESGGEPVRETGRAGKHARREPDKPRPAWLSELIDWAKTLSVALVIVVVVNLFIFNLSTVNGFSMEPTLEEREWLFINKIGYAFGDPERGDVIILKDPSEGPDRKEYLVKRVIGIEGDTIEIRTGQLYLNGELQVEPYTDVEIESPDFGPAVVEPGKVFVMGDNRRGGASKDSRSFGTVALDGVKGKAEFVIWPITKLKKL